VTAGTQVRPAAPATGSFRATLQRLAGAQKGSAGAPAYSRFVNRKLGRVMAALAFHAGLTPNAVTAISAAFTGTGLGLLALAPHTWRTGLAVTACLVVGYALDAADGQLARLRGGGSPAGEWLDHMVDSVKACGLHLVLLIGLYRSESVEPAVLLIPIAYCVVDSSLFFGTMLNEALRAQHGVATRAQPTDGRPSLLRSLAALPTDYGLLCLLFLLLGVPGLFLPAYGLMFAGTTAYLVLGSFKWFREMGRLPR
jgi:phosphatidylglycerophosphate synthase